MRQCHLDEAVASTWQFGIYIALRLASRHVTHVDLALQHACAGANSAAPIARPPASASGARGPPPHRACLARWTRSKRRLAARAGKAEDDGYEDRSAAYRTLVREVLEAQRAELVRLRAQGTISAEVMRRLERELDLEDQRLEI